MQKAAGGQPLAAFFRTAPYFRACRLSSTWSRIAEAPHGRGLLRIATTT